MERYQFSSPEMTLMERSSIPFAIYQFIDKHVVTLVLSEGFLELFDLEREDAYHLMDHDMYRDTHPDDAARAANAAFRFATEGGEYNVAYRTKHKDTYRIIHARGEHIHPKPGVTLAVIWYTNEGEYKPDEKESENKLNRAYSKVLPEETLPNKYYYDLLSGLPNMTGFLEIAAAKRETMREKGVLPAVVFFNLNGMKYYNRRFGYDEGDRLLRNIGKILASHFGNDNCGRFGMDIFAVITDSENVENKIQAVFTECTEAGNSSDLTVRAGIALDQIPEKELIAVCDRAKYACDTNRGAYLSCYSYFNESMLAEVEKQRYVINNLDKAIRENWIKVYYQPIVRTANGRVCDEEALARWIDPVEGFLTPSDFILTLENAKLIYKLDLFILEEVLRKLQIQAEKGLEIVPVSINLSRTDFDACDIVEEIRRRVDASGVGRDKITIEITESVVGSDTDFIKEQVERFQQLGFQVWMDDFGSGYSSLDVLQSIRFDLIKFDMRFMQRFDEGDECKIILTELMKMAIALGVDTLAEGVERKDQFDFLREVGCTKVQGYYYCKPILMEQVFERYEKGTQIGFENTKETDYYSAIGRINLYDTALIVREDKESFQNYFDTVPMTVIESCGDSFRMIRCNRSFRDFVKRMDWTVPVGKLFPYDPLVNRPGLAFMKIIRQCGEEGSKAIIDDVMPNGLSVHAFIRRIAVNPVTNTAAIAVVVLGIMENDTHKSSLTYASIAQALSSDYFDLFYVNLVTEDFIHYSTSHIIGNIDVERRGKNFFEEARKDALRILYEPDRENFIKTFTKENVVKAIDDHEAFSVTYRQMYHGSAVYVNMKAVRISKNSEYIIIGINNIDAQMQQQEAMERVKQERLTYSRIAALSGDLICIYTVDPETDHYIEYSAIYVYEDLGLSKEGDDFFKTARIEARQMLVEEDIDRFLALFSKEQVLKSVEENNIYGLRYRLLIDGNPVYVSLKAAMVDEEDGKRLIIGIHDIDSRLKRDHEYERNIAIAYAEINIDSLTGLKNRHAYEAVAEQLDELINESESVKFSVTVLGMKSLTSRDLNLSQDEETRWVKQAADIISGIFKRSPVFRLDRDEFAVISQGSDYQHLESLIDIIARSNAAPGGIEIPYGTAKYEGDTDTESVYKRAVENMKEKFGR